MSRSELRLLIAAVIIVAIGFIAVVMSLIGTARDNREGKDRTSGKWEKRINHWIWTFNNSSTFGWKLFGAMCVFAVTAYIVQSV